MTRNCSGTDRANSAADPDWFEQARQQMSDLYLTLHEINDPTCFEAWDQLESAIEDVRRFKSQEKVA